MIQFLRAALLVLIGVVGGVVLASTDKPDEYEPLVAAPGFHRPVVENELVRVLDVRIKPGETVPAHQHGLPSVFITLAAADLVFRDLEGNVVRELARDDVSPPAIEWRSPAPAPRTVTNVGSTELTAIRVELKTPSK